MTSSFWQAEPPASLSIRYPLTPILEDDYFGCEDGDVIGCDADDEDEDDIMTQSKRHLFASKCLKRRPSLEDTLEEEITSEDLFESLDVVQTSEDSFKT